MGSLGPTEIILILAILLLVFGAKKLPEIGKSFGKGLREFKKATKNISEDINIDSIEEDKSFENSKNYKSSLQHNEDIIKKNKNNSSK